MSKLVLAPELTLDRGIKLAPVLGGTGSEPRGGPGLGSSPGAARPLAVGRVPERPLAADQALALGRDQVLAVVPACELAVQLAMEPQDNKMFTSLESMDCTRVCVCVHQVHAFSSLIFLPHSIR